VQCGPISVCTLVYIPFFPNYQSKGIEYGYGYGDRAALFFLDSRSEMTLFGCHWSPVFVCALTTVRFLFLMGSHHARSCLTRVPRRFPLL